MIVEMTNIETGGSRFACAAGQFHLETNRALYAPSWILEHLGIHSDEAACIVRPVVESLPQATLIVLQSMDSALYHTDMRALFEERLYTFHVLQKGTSLSVCAPELGGYEMCARVERLEPADAVVLGQEVNVEFLEPEGGVLEFAAQRTPTPPPADPALLTPPANETMGTAAAAETAEERMARIRAAWLQKYGKGNT